MANKLYVGKLPYSTTEQELKDLFAEYGTVETATIIADKFSGQSKGFGFVEMSDEKEAQAAIAGLNNKDISGRTIIVGNARPMEDRPKTNFHR